MADKKNTVSFDEWANGAEVKPAKTGILGRAGDLGLSALKSAISVPETAVGLANLVSGGKAGKAVESAGIRFKDAKDILDAQKSDAAKDAEWRFQNAEGFTGKLGAAVENPSLIANTLVESAAPMLAGGVVGRGISMAAPRLAGYAGAIGEGAIGAGSASEQIRQESTDGELSGKQAALAGASGLATGLLGYGGSKLASRLGVGDIDTALAGGARTAGVQAGKEAPGMLKRIGGGALSEGVLEELPQSVSEQMLQNVALDRDPMQGVDAAAAMGLLSGGLMGGGMGIVSGQAPTAAQPPAQPPVAPTTTPGAPLATTTPAGPTLGQSLTSTPMADLMGGGGLTGGANPLQAGLSTLTSNNQMYPGMNTEPTGYTVDPETGAIIPAEPVGVRQMDEPAQQVEAPAPVATPAGRTLGESLTGTPVADMLGSGGMSGQSNPLQSVLDTSTPSQRMGLNPAAGGLTAAAAIAVDSGASPATAGMGLRALSGAAPAAQPVTEQSATQQQAQPPAQQPIMNNGKPFTLAEVGKANQSIGGTAVSVPGGWAIQPPATAQQTAATPPTAMPPATTPAASTQSAILGRNSQPIAEGGQPFATREEAKAEKRLHPLMRVAPAEGGGFILKPATERQLAAIEIRARQLAIPQTGEKGYPSLHGFLVEKGRLNKSAMSDLGFDTNPVIGNRTLFSPIGMTLEQATIKAKAEGYIKSEDQNEFIEALKRSLNVSPVYTPDGYEAMAEAQMQARYEDFLAAEQDGGAENDWSRLTPEELADTGYNDYDEATQAEIRARVAQAEALGVDAESILEDVARRTEKATQKDYENAAKSAIEAAIRSSEESRSRDLGQASAEAGPATADTKAAPAAVTGPASDIRARNLAALKARMMGQKKPTPTTPPAPSEQEIDAKTDEVMAAIELMGGNGPSREITRRLVAEKGFAVADKTIQSFQNEAKARASRVAQYEGMKKAAQKTPTAPNQQATPAAEQEKPLPPNLSAKLQEAHRALGRDVTRSQVQRMRDSIAREVEMGTTNNGGVIGKLTPKAIATRREQLQKLDADLALFDGQQATPAPEAGPTNQGAENGQGQETLLKAEQPTGAAAMVSGAPVATGNTWNAGNAAAGDTTKPERQYNLVAINEKTGKKTQLNATPLTHQQAVTMKSKNTEREGRRIQLEQIVQPSDTTKPGGFIDRAKKAAGKVATAPVAAQQTEVETLDANQKNSGGGLPSPISSKKTYSALLPFNIQGNKTQLLANGMDAFLRNAAKGARRVIDAFGGAAAYTHALSHNGDLPTGSVYNEFEPLRYITNKQIKENVEQVIARLEFHIGKINAMLATSEEATAKRKLTADYVINGINSHKQDGVPEHAKGLKSPPSNMADSPDLAALYLIAQNSRFGYRPIQSDVGEDGKLRVMSDGENDLVSITKNGEKVTLFGRGKDKLINSASNLRAASNRLQGVDVRMGDGWMIGAKEASAGDVLLVDTSYLNKTDKNTGKTVETANYNKATQEDAIPAVYKEKVTENLLPAWDRGAKIVITNNWNDDVAAYLKNLGFTVIQDQRAKGVSNDTRELIAINFNQRTGAVDSRRGAVSGGATGRSGKATDIGGNGSLGQDGVRGLAAGAEGQNGAVPRSGRGRLNPGTGAGRADAAPAQPILTAPTKADIEAQQARAEQAAKAKAAQDKADAARAAKERERKEVAAASVAAADTFELGQDAMANLTGQQDVFGAMEQEAKPVVSANTIFTEDAAAKARARLKSKLGRLNSGLDPEMMMDGITLAGYHIEKGARTFAAYARAMIEDLGDGVKPYLKSWYMGVKYDPRAASFDGMDGAAAVESADINALTAQQETQDVPSPNTSVERDSRQPATEPAVGDVVQDGRRPDATGDNQVPGQPGGSDGGRQPDGVGVPADGPVVDGIGGDLSVHSGDAKRDAAVIATGAEFSERGSGIGNDGVSAEPVSTGKVAAVAQSSSEKNRLTLKQKQANSISLKYADLDNIKATLPMLLDGQQEDVFKAETRFQRPDGYGMLFTNGTGTGKTFTGLGIIKRMQRQGKTNILVVVPDEKIGDDWIGSAKLLGLNVSKLSDTKDAGKGIVLTTYANLGSNDALATRAWDLVVADEAHNLMKSSDGTVTTYLQNLRAITMHPDGAFQRYAMLNREKIDRSKALSDEILGLERMIAADSTTAQQRAAWDAKIEALQKELGTLRGELDKALNATRADVKANQGAKRTRLAALSATPFAYEFTIDWANGYLFDYNDGQVSDETESRGYNSGSNRERFFMQHFGYSMRYNKLTKPDPTKVDTGLMQRSFNTMLKKAGSLSGRMLDVKADYDRRFVLVDSAIGNQIDEALNWISDMAGDSVPGFGTLRDVIGKKFDYLSRRYLLEAIKAKEAVPIVRKHMEMGRKVVVFHDYKKGGGFNPFNVSMGDAAGMDSATEDTKALAAAIDSFKQKFAALVNTPFQSLLSPIEVFRNEFPGVLLINGDEKKPDLLARYKAFQDDATGPQVALVQSAKNAGWSGHDTTGKHQRVLINLGQPTAPTLAIQQEGRIYRTGQVSNAIMRYMNTGTNWEKWAFATTIAGRASAAENLGMGELSRALKDSFIGAFEESDAYPPGHEGEGTGGKERDAAQNNQLTAWDRAKSLYWATQKKNSRTKAQDGVDYFATPEPVGMKMAEWLGSRGGERTLEPSAGHGAIARWLPETTKRTVIEPSNTLRSRLALVMNPSDDRILDVKFEALDVVNKFDGIATNPPFGVGGKTAIEHLAKAATHLADGGRIVALIPTGPAADKRFDQWMYGEQEGKIKPLGSVVVGGKETFIYKGDTIELQSGWAPPGVVIGWRQGVPLVKATAPEFRNTAAVMVDRASIKSVKATGPRTEKYRAAKDMYTVGEVLLPSVTFERAGTAVSTRIVVLEKQSKAENAPNQKGTIDLSGLSDINDLFGRMENMTMPERKMTEAQKAEVEAEQKQAEASAAKTERNEAAKKQSAAVGDKVTLAGKEYDVVVYTTNAGKEIRGAWVKTKELATRFNDRTFQKKPLGWFVREKDFPRTDANQKPSLSRAKEQPLTPASTIRAAIAKAYGNLLDKLEGKGLVTIAQTEREAIEAAAQARADKTGGDADAIAGRMMSMAGLDVKYSANGNIEGFFDKQTGKSFLVADNLTAASAPGTLMHEVGIHMAADGKLEPLFKRAGILLKTGTQNEFIQRVKARMARAGETSDEEAAAYIVTEYENDQAKAPITIGKWLADLTAAVRAWLFGKGVILKAEQLTVADIAAVARANARSMARGGPNGGPGGWQAFSRAEQQSDPDIRFSRGGGIDHADLGTVGENDSPSSQWDAPLASSWDDKIYKLQDKNIDTKRVIQSIKKMAGDIQDKLNVYLQEELYHGRTAKRVLEFGRGELNPALDELAAMGYSIEDLEEYMHARHAPEANVVLAARNPTREMIDTARAEAKAEIKRLKAELSVDGLGKDEAKALKAELKKAEAKLKSWTGVAAFKGTEEERNSLSGMKTEEAEAYFRNLPAEDSAKLKKVADKMDAIMAETSNMMVAYHLESQETVDGWNAMYRHYIPLHREGKDDGSMGTGQGFSIKGREVKGRTGSRRKVVNIVAHIAEAREKTIVRGEKNRVAQALVGLVTKYPNADFWKTGAPPSERVFDRATGKVKNQVNPAYKSLPNVVMAKVMGEDGKVKEVAVTFNENDERAVRMAGALKNLDTPQIEGWLGTVAKATRYFAAVNTQFNPIFGAVNLVRDVQGAMINLGATPLADQKMKIARDSVDALAGIYRDIRATRRGEVGSSRWSELYEQFQHDGGQTGFRNLFETTDDRSQELKDRVSPTDWAKTPLGRIMSVNGKLTKQAQWMRDGFAIARDWLSDYNETMESATRLAVYKAALDKGMTREQAASMAKNITVNFNRKGTMGTQAGALYAFFNAAMQGTARMGETLVTMEPGQPKTMRLSAFGKKVVYGGVLLGAIQALALAAGGFGDEEPPDFERERNLLIPTGWTGVGPDKGYIKIPMPLGLHVIPGIGRMGMEFVLSGGEDPAKATIKFGSMMADAFNPIGNAGLSMQTIAPTVLDPLAALVENKDWTGKNIARESFNKDAPMFSQHKDSATFVAKFLAELVNYATGGNEYVGGALNWSPDQIDYLIGQVTGGVGRELSKVEQTATGAFTGDETPIYKVPLLGRFAGSASGKSGEANSFYTNADKLNRLETELKGMVKDGKAAEAAALRMERPESRMIVGFNMAERQVQKLRKQKSALIEAGASAADVRAVDERITAIMQNMNQRMLSVTGN